MSKADKERIKNAREQLQQILKPGDTVYCVLCHVSRSGMQREIKFYARQGNEMRYLSGYMEALGLGRRGKREGNIVGGCGMDMGFHLVYNLGRVLYPGGVICAGKHCPSNDHSNGDRNYEPHCHTDGGYAFRSEWL